MCTTVDEAEEIRDVLRRAGEIALGYFRRVAPRWKESGSLVTEADLAVQSFLVDWLIARYPGDGVIAEEEGCQREAAHGGEYWTIDPIDGTASFVAGLPVWGIGIGRAKAELPQAGYFYMPLTGDYFACAPGMGVRRNGEHAAMKKADPLHRESVLLSISRLHRQVSLPSSFPGKVRSLGSTIGHMCYVATGSAEAALLGRVWLWDILPGWALLKNAGGVLKYLNGPAVILDDLINGSRAKNLMICGHPDTVQRYEELLSYSYAAGDRA